MTSFQQPSTLPPQHPSHASWRSWAGLALLSLPTIMLGLDLTLLHLILPALAADLQPSSIQALWIMDAYGFLIAGFLVTMGALGDRIGRRKLLLIGATAFAIASTVAAFATHATTLIAARASLGIAGATLMPSTLALISNLFPNPRQRALSIGIWTTMWGIGYALGPSLGGLLLEWFWWGAAFLVAIPVAILLLVLSPYLLPEYRSPHNSPLDLLSVALSLAAILPLVYGIKTMATSSPELSSIITICMGLSFLWLFIKRQRQLASPLIDLSLFSNASFSIALIVLLCSLIAIGGTMLLVAQYLQLIAGLTAVEAGFYMGIAALAMITGGIAAPLLARSIDPAYVVAGSLLLSALGYTFLLLVNPSSPNVTAAMLALVFAYLGNGTVAALGTELVISTAPPDKTGAASAMAEMAQDFGISLGIALLGSMASAVYRHNLLAQGWPNLSDTLPHTVTDSLWAASSVLEQLPEGIYTHAQTAFISGLHAMAIINAFGIIILAIISAKALRNIK